MCTIYKITNLTNNKVYIGQTWKDDLQRYFKESHTRVKGRIKLYRAIQKYGANNFIIEPILIVDTQLAADQNENLFIQKYNSIKKGYNLRSGGSHGRHSEESKKKIGAASKGRKHSDESKKRISASHTGKKLSFQTKNKMSKAKIGKHTSPDTEFKKGHVGNKKYTRNEEALIVSTYKDLRSSYKVAKLFGCSNVTVLNIMNRFKDNFQQFPGNKTEFNKESD